MEEDERDWEGLYRGQAVETMPWYYPDLDPDFKTVIAELGVDSGRVLDMGTGPGTQATALAKMGFDVTATDISATAIELAKAKAKKMSLSIDFRRDDILQTRLDKTFDYIFDRGLFHTLAPGARHVYVENVLNLLNRGGYLFLKCFSHKEKSPGGPHRLSPQDIEDNFGARLNIVSIADTVFPGAGRGVRRALFVVMKKAV